jgi:hypothetical protein
MIHMASHLVMHSTLVHDAADIAVKASIRYAAFRIRKHIRESIKKSEEPAEPGKPVATRGRRGNVKNAIYAAIGDNEAVIGPRYSFVKDVMKFHEFGLRRMSNNYAARPTMAPALKSNLQFFHETFRGSIGQ